MVYRVHVQAVRVYGGLYSTGHTVVYRVHVQATQWSIEYMYRPQGGLQSTCTGHKVVYRVHVQATWWSIEYMYRPHGGL